jgi:hypothetical protein
MDDLITDYMAIGVKAAGTIHNLSRPCGRLLKGTREVNIALLNPN